LAPVAPIENVPEDGRDVILTGQKLAFIPLPGVPDTGDAYADLRSMVAVDRRFVEIGTRRLATMTDVGVSELQARLTGFFARDVDPSYKRAPIRR